MTERPGSQGAQDAQGQRGQEGRPGTQGRPGSPGISAGAKRAAFALLVLVLLVGGGNLLASYDQVQASQHRWCSVLVTLDNADQKAEHAPPAERPHGAYSDALIGDFHSLRQQFCG
jgi:hypothetical protein